MQCSLTGDATDESISDLFALNSYSWCGPATFEEAGYNTLVDFFRNSSIPVFMSEYGCRDIRPRIFDETAALYSSKMTPYFSGGVVYEYTEEANDFGLVVLNADGSAELRVDYDNFQKQLAKLNFTELQSISSVTAAIPFPKCAASLITNKDFPSNFSAIPEPPNDGLAELIVNGVANPKNGKIVTISDLKVKQTVKNSDGTVITGLEVKRLTGGNIPTQTASSTSPTAVAESAAATSTNAAVGNKELGGFGFMMSSLLAALYLI
jgi:1,3-beta-glucanosyltransferase GAS3